MHCPPRPKPGPNSPRVPCPAGPSLVGSRSGIRTPAKQWAGSKRYPAFVDVGTNRRRLERPTRIWIIGLEAASFDPQDHLADMQMVAKALREGDLDFDRVFDATAELIERYRWPITACADALLDHGELDERTFALVVGR